MSETLQSRAESNCRSLEDQVTDSKVRIEEHIRTIHEFTSAKSRLANENMDISHQLEEAENKVKTAQSITQ